MSATSIGSSGNRPRKSFTGESSDQAYGGSDVFTGQDREGGRDESKGPIGWIRSKYREAKENAEQRRNKSPPADSRQPMGLSAAILPTRGKSVEIQRDEPRREEGKPTVTAVPAQQAASTATTTAEVQSSQPPAPPQAEVSQQQQQVQQQPHQQQPRTQPTVVPVAPEPQPQPQKEWEEKK